jgi:hypothetical protein
MYMSAYYYLFVLMLVGARRYVQVLCMCPHTAMYVSAYYCYVCPHTTVCMSAYAYI